MWAFFVRGDPMAQSSFFLNASTDTASDTAITANGTTTSREFQGQGDRGQAVASMWRPDGAALSTESVVIQRQVYGSDSNSWVPVLTLTMAAPHQVAVLPNGSYRAVVSGYVAAVRVLVEAV